MRHQQPRLLVLAGLVTPLALILGCGCSASPAGGSAPSPTLPPSPPVTSTTSTPTPTADPRQAVEDAYVRFWSVSWPVDRQPAAQWPSILAAVAADPELTRLLEGTRVQQRQGIRLYGQVVPHVMKVVLSSPARAGVTDCQDASHAGQADAGTGKPRSVGVARTRVDASLVLGGDGVWRVSDVNYPGSRC